MDVDFVRKAVRAIGRCAIKVEVGGGDVILSHDALLVKSLCHLCSLAIKFVHTRAATNDYFHDEFICQPFS